MLTNEIITRSLTLANLQTDDPELRAEAKGYLSDALRKYSGVMGFAQDYLEYKPTDTEFTIGKPQVRRGKKLTYSLDTLPSLSDYETCGFVYGRDVVYLESDDVFYKITESVTNGVNSYSWAAFTSGDYDVYFQVTPEVIVIDLDTITSIVTSFGYNLEPANLNKYLRGSGDFVITPVTESLYRVIVRPCYVEDNAKPLRIVYGKLVNVTETTNILVSNDYLQLITDYMAYRVAKTTRMKEVMSEQLTRDETKLLDANESDSYMIVPDAWA